MQKNAKPLTPPSMKQSMSKNATHHMTNNVPPSTGKNANTLFMVWLCT